MSSRTGHCFSLFFASAVLILTAYSPASGQQVCICDNSSGCAQTIIGTPGNDSLFGSPVANDCMYGLGGDDTIYSYAGNDHIDGGPGNDPDLTGGAGNDCVCGYDGDDAIHGGDGADVLDGLNGNDWITGGSMADRLYGFDGFDVLRGDNGNDSLFGEGDDDDLNGGTQNTGAADSCDGGPGIDRCTQCEIVNSCEIIY